MRRRLIRHLGVAVGLSGLLAGGCSDKRLDTGNIEGIILERYSQDGEVAEVTCPEVVRTREGETFECRVLLEGGEERVVTVEQLGGTRFRWRPGRAAGDAGAGARPE